MTLQMFVFAIVCVLCMYQYLFCYLTVLFIVNAWWRKIKFSEAQKKYVTGKVPLRL